MRGKIRPDPIYVVDAIRGVAIWGAYPGASSRCGAVCPFGVGAFYRTYRWDEGHKAPPPGTVMPSGYVVR